MESTLAWMGEGIQEAIIGHFEKMRVSEEWPSLP
jgi:hypothetical protein